jgi:hypothetical protein
MWEKFHAGSPHAASVGTSSLCMTRVIRSDTTCHTPPCRFRPRRSLRLRCAPRLQHLLPPVTRPARHTSGPQTDSTRASRGPPTVMPRQSRPYRWPLGAHAGVPHVIPGRAKGTHERGLDASGASTPLLAAGSHPDCRNRLAQVSPPLYYKYIFLNILNVLEICCYCFRGMF